MAVELGAPESVLSNNITSYLGIFNHPSDGYYVPPVSQKGLAQIRHANAHHGTALIFKCNMVMKYFVPNKYISRDVFKRFVMDMLIFGHYYPLLITNRLDGLVRLDHLPAVNMRRRCDTGSRKMFCKLTGYGKDNIKFKHNEVLQIKEYDPEQSYYGMPEYFAGLQALLLNEAATLFRRRYYANGNHAGYIFYTNDPNLEEADEKAIKDAIKNSRGVGNFRSMYLNIPNGKADGVKLIPVGDVGTKDEFERIKNISRNDVISVHRVNPALAAVMPENTTGFGDIEKISRVYHDNEVIPLQAKFLELNEVLGFEVIRFDNPEVSTE